MGKPKRDGLAAVLPAAALSAVAAALLARGAYRRLGATDEEVGRTLPGDSILDAIAQNDRAITISVQPAGVWPLIAQLGRDRAGFYSFEALENVMGCDIENAGTIHPEWQEVAVGGSFPLAPGMVLRVADVETEHHLLVASEGGEHPADAGAGFDFTWCFCLTPVTASDGRLGTRLHIRERSSTPDRRSSAMLEATSAVSAIMTWRMLRTIRRLAQDEESRAHGHHRIGAASAGSSPSRA